MIPKVWKQLWESQSQHRGLREGGESEGDVPLEGGSRGEDDVGAELGAMELAQGRVADAPI